MITRIKLIALLILISGKLLIAQRTVIYNYKNNNNIKKSQAAYPLGGAIEFSTKRIYLINGQFKESMLFTANPYSYIKYRIVNNDWYWKTNGAWNLLFKYKEKKGGTIEVANETCKITVAKQLKIRNMIIYKIAIKPINKTWSNRPWYYFEPNKGFVIIKTPSGGLLLRNDCFNSQLSDKDLDKLE